MKPPSRSRSKGATLVELLVVIGIIALLVSLLLPALSKANENANKGKCASNLKQIGLAMMMYANDNGGFPRLNYTTGFAIDCTNSFGGAQGTTVWNNPINNVPGCLFLVLQAEDLTSAVFCCPSTDAVPDTYNGGAKTNQGNFTSYKNLSYSLQAPYPTANAVTDGFEWDSSQGAEFAIAADMNPGDLFGQDPVAATSGAWPNYSIAGAANQRKGNSLNHNKAGQNVLYADGHVSWSPTPLAGWHQDNIYTSVQAGRPTQAKALTPVGGDVIGGPPNYRYDSVMLPCYESRAGAAGVPGTGMNQ